ncbi:hypothetical protein AHAS_Ahas19G0207800 [Arachis hypogaea]
MVKQNFMGYHPPSPIPIGGWEYHQENINSRHSNPWRFASETQDEKENHMGYFPPPQNDASHYSNGGWEYYQEIANSEQSIHMRDCPTSPSISTFENSSSPNYASTQNPSQDSQPTQTSMSQRLSKLESMFNRYVEETKKSWKEQENSLRKLEVLVAQLLSAKKKRKGKMRKPLCQLKF